MDDLHTSSTPENSVVYRGFVISSPSRPPPNLAEISGFRQACLNSLGHRLAGYIWQEESFNLTAVERTDIAGFPHLVGSTYFGDNIEDEWVIVDLLFHLSELFPNLAFQIEDSDGDFLLIEAADVLPSWLSPSTATNRVFIFDGSLHIIPVGATPALLTNIPAAHTSPSIDCALVALRSFGAAVTRASKPIQLHVDERRKNSRGQTTHRARCRLPARVAAILRVDPRLVASAVRAFYLRDPIDLRACRAAVTFPPREAEMLSTNVTFTRCLYAQLTSQKFVADRRSPWAGKQPVGEKEKKAWNLGLRIACGFEIIMSRNFRQREGKEKKTTSAKEQSDEQTMEISTLNEIDDSPEWRTFLDSLKRNGFFQKELEGSKKWKELMANALQFYRESIVLKEKEEETEYVSDEIKEKIDSILSSPNCVSDVASLRAEEANLEPEDDENWMIIDPKELDDALEKYRRKENIVDQKADKKRSKKSKLGGTEEDFDLGQISKSLKQFVQHVSDFDGAEFPDSAPHSNSLHLLDSDDSSEEEKNDAPIKKAPSTSTASSKLPASTSSNDYNDIPTDDFDFDVDSFSKALEAMMSKSKGASQNQPSSGIATDEDYSSRDSDDDFLTDDDDDDDEGIDTIKNYMREMDRELAKTEMGKSFLRKPTDRPHGEAAKAAPTGSDAAPAAAKAADSVNASALGGDDEENEDEPLDIDLTLVQNILESYSTQPGFAGPATNILNSMGISLPDPERP